MNVIPRLPPGVNNHMGVPLDGVLLGLKPEVQRLRLTTPFLRKLVEDNILVWKDGLDFMWSSRIKHWSGTMKIGDHRFPRQKIFGPNPTGTPRNRGPV